VGESGRLFFVCTSSVPEREVEEASSSDGSALLLAVRRPLPASPSPTAALPVVSARAEVLTAALHKGSKMFDVWG